MKTKTKLKQTEIGMIHEDWEVRNIQDLLLPEKGTLKIGPFGSQLKKDLLVSDGFKIYGQENVFKNDFSLGDRFVTKERFRDLQSCEVRPGDILLSMMGTIGFVAIVPENIRGGIMDSHLLRLRINEGMLDKKFLLYAFRSNLVQNQINSLSVGTIMSGLSSRIIRMLTFPYPPFPEQQAIGKILSDLDAKIELNQQMNKTLEAVGKAIFKRWFIDFEFPNEEGKPYKSSGGEMVYNEELGKEIPKGWEVKRLGEVSDNYDSKRIPLSNREREVKRGLYPYYGATGILDYVDGFIFDGTHILMGEDGSVVDDEGHPILQYVWGKFWANNHAHVLRGKNISNELLYMFLKNTSVSHIVTGAVQPKINQNNMNKLKFTLPEQKTLYHFQNILDSLFEKFKANFEQIDNLTQTRDILLPKLMSGKIKVPVHVK